MDLTVLGGVPPRYIHVDVTFRALSASNRYTDAAQADACAVREKVRTYGEAVNTFALTPRARFLPSAIRVVALLSQAAAESSGRPATSFQRHLVNEATCHFSRCG